MNAAARRWFVVSGCSGGGKSTLLGELARRGYATVAEPGRRVIAEQQASGGGALPWGDAAAFAGQMVAMARGDLVAETGLAGPVFFDRGLIDALAARARAGGTDVATALEGARPYERGVFLAPPWPEIYRADPARRHGLAEAEAEYADLAALYPRLGYIVHLLPQADVAARADFVLDRIA